MKTWIPTCTVLFRDIPRDSILDVVLYVSEWSPTAVNWRTCRKHWEQNWPTWCLARRSCCLNTVESKVWPCVAALKHWLWRWQCQVNTAHTFRPRVVCSPTGWCEREIWFAVTLVMVTLSKWSQVVFLIGFFKFFFLISKESNFEKRCLLWAFEHMLLENKVKFRLCYSGWITKFCRIHVS